jgi:hypothetical protein
LQSKITEDCVQMLTDWERSPLNRWVVLQKLRIGAFIAEEAIPESDFLEASQIYHRQRARELEVDRDDLSGEPGRIALLKYDIASHLQVRHEQLAILCVDRLAQLDTTHL